MNAAMLQTMWSAQNHQFEVEVDKWFDSTCVVTKKPTARKCASDITSVYATLNLFVALIARSFILSFLKSA